MLADYMRGFRAGRDETRDELRDQFVKVLNSRLGFLSPELRSEIEQVMDEELCWGE